VFAAAVILHPDRMIHGLQDSKKLSQRRREQLEIQIKSHAMAWSVAEASVAEIDRLNILQATLLAMQRAVDGLEVKPGRVQVDGNRCPALAYPVEAVVRGDATVAPISAASILAKTARDRAMGVLHLDYPQFGFDRHFGYGTAQHMDALRRYGPCAAHRRSFSPVREWLQENRTRDQQGLF
jgi:ribonuclease HII